jgi:hypothetical protein
LVVNADYFNEAGSLIDLSGAEPSGTAVGFALGSDGDTKATFRFGEVGGHGQGEVGQFIERHNVLGSALLAGAQRHSWRQVTGVQIVGGDVRQRCDLRQAGCLAVVHGFLPRENIPWIYANSVSKSYRYIYVYFLSVLDEWH